MQGYLKTNQKDLKNLSVHESQCILMTEPLASIYTLKSFDYEKGDVGGWRGWGCAVRLIGNFLFFPPFFPGHHLGVGYNIYSHVRMLSMKVGHLVLLHVICKCVLSQ